MPTVELPATSSEKTAQKPPKQPKAKKQPKVKKQTKTKRQPKYSHHKPTDTARVWLWGKSHSLGKFNSPESWDKYHQLLAEYNKYGDTPPPSVTNTETTIAELAIHYTQHVVTYYKNVPQTVAHCKKAMKLLVKYYEREFVNNFSPLSLKFLQEKLLDAKYVRKGEEKRYARQSINRWIGIIKAAFKFGVQEGWVTGNTIHALSCVDDLKQGRCDAPEYRRVMPVSDEVLQATLPFLPPVIQDMVRVQRYIGGRPQDVRNMRYCDIDFSPYESDGVWYYTPPTHKTANKGKGLIKVIGPRAQAALTPYLQEKRNTPEAYIFSPADSMRMRFIEQRRNRKTLNKKGQPQPSQINRRKRKPKKKPGEQYSISSYARAIKTAVEKAIKAGILSESDKWHPNQLRHASATEAFVKTEGDYQQKLETAQSRLGHTETRTTKNYLEGGRVIDYDMVKATKAAKAWG